MAKLNVKHAPQHLKMYRRHSEFNTYYYCNNHYYQTLVMMMFLKIERKKEPSTFLLLFPFPGFFKMKSPFNHRPEPYLPLSAILWCPLEILCCKLHSSNAFLFPSLRSVMVTVPDFTFLYPSPCRWGKVRCCT